LGRKISDFSINILGIGAATDYLNYPSRDDLSRFVAAEYAVKTASKMSNVEVSDMQILEVNDESTVMEMISLEDLGLYKPGTAWKGIHEGLRNSENAYLLGDAPLYVNTDGGLKADGNPLGATGGAQIFEVFRQLRGEAEERQVRIADGLPNQGCVVEFEGFGTKAYATVLGRKK
jgi:acetyl-CoA C-acetyltransferase